MRRRHFMFCASALILGSAARPGRTAQRQMTVYKDANCGCCEAWTKAMQAAGFPVDIRPVDDMAAVKVKFGIPQSVEGCHTAYTDGYIIEGHVPVEAVERLLKERPAIKGLAVPGMPNGSLGMGDDPTVASYDVMSVDRQGNAAVFMRIRPRKA